MKFFKKSDIAVIAVLLLCSLVVWLIYDNSTKGDAVKAEIYYYSQLVKTVPLDEHKDVVFSIDQESDVVLHISSKGKIAFIASDCPDKVCINTGELYKAGQYAACLPNGITVKIVPAGERNEEDVDIILP